MPRSNMEARSPVPAWRIRPFREGDEQQLLMLFERTFGHARSLADWQWKFLGRESAFPHIWVAELPENGRLVGHYAGIPARVKLGSREVNAVVSVETMTDPDFRRQGMLTNFGEIVYRAWDQAGQSLIVGLPNQQWGSRKVALGWAPVATLEWLRFPVQAEHIALRDERVPVAARVVAVPPLRLASRLWLERARRLSRRLDNGHTLTVRPYSGEKGVFDAIWRYASPGWENLVVRDEQWIQWRYLAPVPPRYKLHVAWRGNRPHGFAAFLTTNPGSHEPGYIADIFTRRGDLAAASALVMSVLDDFFHSGARLALSLAVPSTPLYKLLRSLGFFGNRAGRSFSFEVVLLDAALSVDSLGSAADWHIAPGNSDVV